MKLFIDSADVTEIAKIAKTGLIDGVTTNPSLIAKNGGDIKKVIAEIAELVTGDVSAEVTAEDHDTMMKEAAILREIAPNIAIKVPLTPDGLLTCHHLSEQGVRVNVTLCFTPAQAVLAAKAGAAYISPFVGRLDDLGESGMGVISDICAIYHQYEAFTTEILVASVRSPNHVVNAALLGADVATIPPKVLHQMYHHPLTDKGLDAFKQDWAATGQSIL